jgi:hypothetical protein
VTVAVCIGVSHYADAVIGPLPGAAREVAEIAAALIAETRCALNPARVEAIGKERAPTTTEIVEALKRGTARAGPEDVLFVYFPATLSGMAPGKAKSTCVDRRLVNRI